MKKRPINRPKRIKPIYYYIGNVLILCSFVGFVAIFLPLFTAYFFPPPLQNIETLRGYVITIPKIKAQSIVVDNVDPWNERVYQRALKHGIAHGKGFAEPGEKGLIYFFAHSSGLPWELTRYNTIFLRLGELHTKDQIFITYQNKRFVYSVTKSESVWPNDVAAIVKEKDKDEIVLQTCTPIGTSFQRLLIFATTATP